MSNPSAAQLSVWELISHASLLVQAVMLILLLASIISWYVIIKQSIRLRQETAANKVFLSQFRQQPFPLATTEPSEPKSGGLGRSIRPAWMNFIHFNIPALASPRQR